MTAGNLISDTEDSLRELAASLTDVRERECLLCYVYRMLEFGCAGHRWAGRYRDVRAPRATGLERRLSAMGGFCDCEIFMNAYEPIPQLCVPGTVDDDPDRWVEPEWPERMPPCRGVRTGSTRPCSMWMRSPRW